MKKYLKKTDFITIKYNFKIIKNLIKKIISNIYIIIN